MSISFIYLFIQKNIYDVPPMSWQSSEDRANISRAWSHMSGATLCTDALF